MPAAVEALCYRLCRYVLVGPVLWIVGRPRILGRHNLPGRGPLVVAANHLAVLDSFYLALALRRPVKFLAKAEYFDGAGLSGAVKRWFFLAVGQIPVDRRGGASAGSALDAATRVVESGGVWGIHPEGTRSPDGRLYRGRTGAVRVALATGTALIPVAITGTRNSGVAPWWRRRVVVEILPEFDMGATRADVDVRAATDELMQRIASRTGQEYVDSYARTWTSEPAKRLDAA